MTPADDFRPKFKKLHIPASSSVPDWGYLTDYEESANTVLSDTKTYSVTFGSWKSDYCGVKTRKKLMYHAWCVYPVLEPEVNEWGEVSP